MSDIEETFEVEAVAGIKKNFRKKTVEVYIKWKGQPRSASSWEDLDNANCEELLKPFKKGIKRLKGQIKLDPDEDNETEDPLDTGIYEVEDVIGVMFDFAHPGIMYYIKWKDWDNKYNNWEPEENVDCPIFTDFFEEAADFLREKYEIKRSKKRTPAKRRFEPEPKPKSSSRTARAVTPEVSGSDDDEPLSKRPGPKSAKAGPKSKTKPGPVSAKKPGPASTKKPGPASATKPGPMSAKKPGPLSAQKAGPKSKANGDKAKTFSDSDSDNESKVSKVSNSNGSKKEKDDSDDESVSSTNKRPGPKSRVGPASATKPGPMSKKKAGPKSKVGGDDGSDSD